MGGNLVIESLQDISNYAARDRSGGVQVSLCIPPICYGASSVSGNYGQTRNMVSDYVFDLKIAVWKRSLTPYLKIYRASRSYI